MNTYDISDFTRALESDNDDIDINVENNVTINNETAVDDAGEDSKASDVSDPCPKATGHNEVASAGGISTGENQDDLEIDPVAATESYIHKTFAISREEMDEIVQDVVVEAENIPDSTVDESPAELSELEEVTVSGGNVVDPDEQPNETPSDSSGETPAEPSTMSDGPEDNDAPGTTVSEEEWDRIMNW